jgi:tetratricopeptide (TPR) repeat protein
MARGLILLLALAVCSSGCAGGQSSVADARKLLRAGETGPGCEMVAELVKVGAGSTGERLEGLRLFIDCTRKLGELDRAEARVEGLQAPGLRLYGQAMITLARSPANLDAALSLLDRAGKAMPQASEIPYRAGLIRLMNGEATLARPLLEKSYKLEATAACAVTLAHALLDLGQTEAAMAQIIVADKLQPGPREIKRGRALVRRIQRRTRAVPPGARQRFQRAMSLLRDEDKASECLRAVEEVILEYPNFPGAHTLMGLAQLRLSNPAEAVVALRRAEALNPLDATNPFYLALIYHKRQRWDDTARLLQRALRLDPFHLRALKLLGEVWLRTRRYKRAATLHDRLTTLQPREPAHLRMAARAHLAAGQKDQAEQRYQRLAVGYPADFEANLRLASLLLERHRAGAGSGSGTLLRKAQKHANAAAKVRRHDPELKKLQAELGLE